MSNLFINNSRKQKVKLQNLQLSVGSIENTDTNQVNPMGDLKDSTEVDGTYTLIDNRRNSIDSINHLETKTLDSNIPKDVSRAINANHILIQDGSINKLKSKIAAAKVIHLYGEANSKNKKIRATLKNILKRTNQQEVFDNRKELMLLEKHILNSDISASSSMRKLHKQMDGQSNQQSQSVSPQQIHQSIQLSKRNLNAEYSNIFDFKRQHRDLEPRQMSISKSIYYAKGNEEMPTNLKLSFDRGDKIHQDIRNLIRKTSTLESTTASQMELINLLPQSYTNLQNTPFSFERLSRLSDHTQQQRRLPNQLLQKSSGSITSNYKQNLQFNEASSFNHHNKRMLSTRDNFNKSNDNNQGMIQQTQQQQQQEINKRGNARLRRSSQQDQQFLARNKNVQTFEKVINPKQLKNPSTTINNKAERELKFNELMNKDWHQQIQKLSDDIKQVKNKEKKHKMRVKNLQQQVGPEQKKGQGEKAVKFNLPEINV